MALAYVRSASDIMRMAEVDFFSRYGEASRAVGFFAEPRGTVAKPSRPASAARNGRVRRL